VEEELLRLKKHLETLSVAMSALGGLLFFGAAYGVFVWVGASVRESLSPKCTLAEDGGLRIGGSGDGPFIITHVVGYGPKGRNVAALPEPFAIVESGGMKLSLAELKKLHWYGADSKVPVRFPEGSTWRVLYLRPEYSPERESSP
jgi:hypothetical protein